GRTPSRSSHGLAPPRNPCGASDARTADQAASGQQRKGGDRARLLHLPLPPPPCAAAPHAEAVDRDGGEDDALGRRAEGIGQAGRDRLPVAPLRSGESLHADGDDADEVVARSRSYAVARRLPLRNRATA